MNDANENTGQFDWEMLALKQLSGEATEDDQVALLAWIKMSEQNKKEYLAFKQQYDASREYFSNPDLFDADSAFENTVSSSAGVSPQGIIRSFYSKVSVAAAAVILLFVSMYFLSQDDSAEPIQIVAHKVEIDTLPDGSVLTLNKACELSYTSDFNESGRHVKLTSGEAFFNVAPDKEKPFIISSDNMHVKVVGTSFNLHFDTAAHVLQVGVSSGTVQVYTDGCADSLFLNKNELAEIEGNNCLSVKKMATSSSNIHAWRTKRLVFDETPLPEVIPQLNKLYNVDISLSPAMEKCRLNAKLDSLKLDEVLSIFELSFGAEIIASDGNSFIIQGESCQ